MLFGKIASPSGAVLPYYWQSNVNNGMIKLNNTGNMRMT